MDIEEFLDEWYSDSPYIKVHTSGSTGKPKELSVEKSRMEASARMTCGFLGLRQTGKALLCMPLDYIAGKMMVVRSIVSGMPLVCVKPSMHPLKYFCEHTDDTLCEVMTFSSGGVRNRVSCPAADVSPDFLFAAMVPSQVKASLDCPEEASVFRRISNMIIGGGHIDAALEDRLQNMSNAIWSTYGMTETLSHIAMRRVNGEHASCWYTPMDGVRVSLTAEHTLVIDAPLLCPSQLVTNDIAEINSHGRFRILGRKDNVINSGGVKIQIEEVESAIRAMLPDEMAEHFAITGCSDERFGEVVAMLTDSEDAVAVFSEALSALPSYWKPKKILYVSSLPQTISGKPDRAAARRIMSEKL